jgi:hypothetical protein
MSAFRVIVQRYRAAMASTARGHIETLPAGSFRVHVYAGTDPVTGKPRRLKQTCPDEGTAAATLGKLLAQADGDRFPNREATLGQALAKYLEVADLELSTREAHEGYIRRTIGPVLGEVKIRKLLPRARHRGQYAADLVARAGGRVGASGAVLEVAQDVLRLGEFGQALPDLGEVLVNQAGDVLAWRLTAVADGQDAADLRKGEVGGLGVADEREPGQGLGWVVPVSGRSPGRRGQQARVLVEPDGLGGQARAGGQDADTHAASLRLTFQCTGRSMVTAGTQARFPGR